MPRAGHTGGKSSLIVLLTDLHPRITLPFTTSCDLGHSRERAAAKEVLAVEGRGRWRAVKRGGYLVTTRPPWSQW